MTPTLIGRWQTRFVTFATLGVIVTAIFALPGDGPFFPVLGYVILFGLIWDVVWIGIQQLRWDRDWPAAFQVATGLWEGIFAYAVASLGILPGIPDAIPPTTFFAHYGVVWLTIFVWVQGPMRVIFPFWRFHGGRVAPAVSARQRRR